MKLEKRTEHFCWLELVRSRTALSHGWENEPDKEAEKALCRLMHELLEPLRVRYGGAVFVSSGYRSAKVNRAVGGVPLSQHLKGEAVDIYAIGTERLWHVLLESGLTFDQAIYYKERDFIHVSLTEKGKNRQQIIYA